MSDTELVQWLADYSGADTGAVGVKNANLGDLADLDVPGLPGVTTIASAHECYVDETGIEETTADDRSRLDVDDVSDLRKRGERLRRTSSEATGPGALVSAIVDRDDALAGRLEPDDPEVAERSSATAADLPGGSVAGRQVTVLNVADETAPAASELE